MYMQGKLAQALLGTAFILSANVACAQDQNLLPKYGSLPKSESLKAADAAFIAAIDQEYHGGRDKASNDAAARGWQYIGRERICSRICLGHRISATATEPA